MRIRYLICEATLKLMKPEVRIINCARGGLIDEGALAFAMRSGHVAGAAIDVFEDEPDTDNVLFGVPGVICTPHIAASTQEAQGRVGYQIADQVARYLSDGTMINAVNQTSRAKVWRADVAVSSECATATA